MKERKPIKRTPLKRGTKRIRQRSEKAEAKHELRKPFVARIIAEREWCEACYPFAVYDELHVVPRKRSQDVHEIIRRSQGGDILDESEVLAVCRPCHDRIDDSTEIAERCGLYLPSWGKGNEIMFAEALARRSGERGNNQSLVPWRMTENLS